MLFLKFLLLAGCFGLLVCAAVLVLYDICLAYEINRLFRHSDQPEPADDSRPPTVAPAPTRRGIEPHAGRSVRWQNACRLVVIGALAGLIGASIVVVPDGQAGVRLSQISGVESGTLYAGTHFIHPLIDHVQL